MTFEAWLSFCITELMLCFTPGPAVLLVFSLALSRGAGSAMAAACGILLANAIYFAVSGLGVAAILVTSEELFLVLKWGGAAYLLWLGLKMILAQQPSLRAIEPPPARQAFWKGLVVQGANPKAIVFFIALLPQFVDVKAPVGYQIFVYGASSAMIEFFALLFYAVLGSSTRRLVNESTAGLLERLGGGFLIGAAVLFAFINPGT